MPSKLLSAFIAKLKSILNNLAQSSYEEFIFSIIEFVIDFQII